MLLPTEKDQPAVDVEHATDEQFQMFVVAAGIPVDEAGIVEWSFDDRCGVINHAFKNGIDLFSQPNRNNSDKERKELENNSESIPDSELSEVSELAQEAH